MEDRRPRILFVGDSAAIDTGMGVAAKEILTRLYATGKYNIASFGWFWHAGTQRGITWKYPWKQYTTNDYNRPYGHPEGWNFDYRNPDGDFKNSPVNQVIEKFKPNVVIAIGDVWMVDFIYFLPTRRTFKLIHEFPIDGEPVPRPWTELVKKADVPIVMTKYAETVCKAVDPYLTLEVIPRGVNTNLFKPLYNKDELRKKHLPSTEGRFVIGVFDRFQDRKQIFRAIEAFAKFKSFPGHDICDLYLHMDVNDNHSKQQNKFLTGDYGIINRYGKIGKDILINKNVTVEKGVKVEELVRFYNCCDVKLSTTQGEGYGLTTQEAMACGIPCIGTNYTTLPELLADGRGLLANVATYITGMYNVERALVDTEHVAQCLEMFYRSSALREQMSKKGRAFALTRDWNIIIKQWLSIIEKMLERPEYRLMQKPREFSLIRSIQEINIQGAVYENTGFSIVTKNFAEALHNNKQIVSVEPRLANNPNNYCTNELLKKLIAAPHNNDIEIINHMPDECVERIKNSQARIKIAYFPWELTKVKDEWIDLINREVDAYWCNSSFIKKLFVENGALEDKIAVIPNGVSINKDVEPYKLITKKKYKFLTVGNLGDVRKNIETLIQAYYVAFSSEDDVCLVLKSQPGHDHSDPTMLCERMKRGHINAPEIEVIHKDVDDLSSLYKACDCFVITSHAEGFSQPVLNALSIGMPVIAPNYGGYLDFTKTERFEAIKYDMVKAQESPVYIENAEWSEVNLVDFAIAMKKHYKQNITKDNKNYVPDYTWDNAAKKAIDGIEKLNERRKKIKCYYQNFTQNMWNDDNRENIKRYALSNIKFVDTAKEADFQILDIAKLTDFNNIQCEKYIINFHCRGEVSEENIKDYLPYFNKAVMVYSHLDLQSELPELKNFTRGAWGTNHRKFYKSFDTEHRYMVLNTGFVPETEGIYESVIAADKCNKKVFHTGPNLALENKSYIVADSFLTTEELRKAYHYCSYVSGMRRMEGFEKTVAEGLFCGIRPICFDTPLFRYWYGDLVEYVKEGTTKETIENLVKIFNTDYRKVTDTEIEIAKKTFSWMYVARNYWEELIKLLRG